jgi:MoxR-like ATPase
LAHHEATPDPQQPDGVSQRQSRLSRLGAYGFEAQEPVIFGALVTGDPILLIGRSGTGKTFLLNSISEALGLVHRHYNASLISFDDLVGFPYPDDDKTTVRFLETPATVWGAESVLIDEISRCKPEHQNRLFSHVHERQVQGLPLPHLRYRWAAMNPCSTDQSSAEDYTGSEPLDPALADRFAVVLEVGDWDALSDDDRRRVADPAGEGAASDDRGCLKAELATWQRRFAARLSACPPPVVDYVCAVTTALRNAGIRLSPRRARLLTRTLLAVLVVEGLEDGKLGGRTAKALFRAVLDASLPQRAWGDRPDPDKVLAAHELAWSGTMLKGRDQWLHHFHLERALDRKARLLFEDCPDPDTGTVAVEQLLANETRERAAAFALAAFPAAAAGRLPIGAEGVNDLGRAAEPLLSVEGEVRWQERLSAKSTTHPELTTYARVLSGLEAERRQRAQQLFYYCAINGIGVREPREFEQEFNRCVKVFSRAGRA